MTRRKFEVVRYPGYDSNDLKSLTLIGILYVNDLSLYKVLSKTTNNPFGYLLRFLKISLNRPPAILDSRRLRQRE